MWVEWEIWADAAKGIRSKAVKNGSSGWFEPKYQRHRNMGSRMTQ